MMAIERSDLAIGQGPAREVVQRTFAADGLVHRMAGGVIGPLSQLAEETCVGRLDEPTDAEMTGRVERLAAERTGWPAGGKDAGGSLDEAQDGGRRQADTHQIGPIRIVVVDLVIVVLAECPRPSLDHHHARIVVPGERDGAHPELLAERLVERPLQLIGARAVHRMEPTWKA